MKTGSLADGAFYPDAAAVGIHDMPRDRKSQAIAACLARSGGIHAVKSSKTRSKSDSGMPMPVSIP